jgi:hypothetical protein
MLYPLSYGRNERADYRSPSRGEKSSGEVPHAIETILDDGCTAS